MKTEKRNYAGEGSAHVLVMALSTFIGKGESAIHLETTNYEYVEELLIEPDAGSADPPKIKKKVVFSCTGYYQLDPVPQFIEKVLNEEITDVILLETKAVREPPEPEKKKYVIPRPDGKEGQWGMVQGEDTVADYFKERLKVLLKKGKSVNVIEIPVDEFQPVEALEEVMKEIRTLYDKTVDKDQWRLWIDTHGGFRDISMVLVSAARLFATKEYDPIRTDGIFSVYHNQDNNIPDQIVNQTAFYFTDSADSLRRFLNYGQYLSIQFRPYEGDLPHAFISYRHDTKFLTYIRNIFTAFQSQELDIPYWFDDGIRYRENWKTVLEEQNRNAKVFIGLLSKSYFESPECWKELLRAIASKRDENGHVKKDQIHFILLEEKITLPHKLPEGKDFEGVHELCDELEVTEVQLQEALGIPANKQWIQAYKYLGSDRQINNSRNPADIKEELIPIKQALNGEY